MALTHVFNCLFMDLSFSLCFCGISVQLSNNQPTMLSLLYYSLISLKCLDHCPWREIPCQEVFASRQQRTPQQSDHRLCQGLSVPHTTQEGILLVFQAGSEADSRFFFNPCFLGPTLALPVLPWVPLRSRHQDGIRGAGQLLKEWQERITERIRAGKGKAWTDTRGRRWGQGSGGWCRKRISSHSSARKDSD